MFISVGELTMPDPLFSSGPLDTTPHPLSRRLWLDPTSSEDEAGCGHLILIAITAADVSYGRGGSVVELLGPHISDIRRFPTEQLAFHPFDPFDLFD